MALQTYYLTFIDDREPISVAPIFADSIAFETHLRANRHLGKLVDNAILSTGYRCWAALRREGRISDTWDAFAAALADIEIEQSADLDADEYALDEAGALAGKSMNPAQ